MLTNSSGEYTLSGLLPGKYIVEFWATEPLNYVTQFYNDKSSIEAADEISVTRDPSTLGSMPKCTKVEQISGEITSSSSLAGIGEVLVCAYEATGKMSVAPQRSQW